jgi:hypothetical protein
MARENWRHRSSLYCKAELRIALSCPNTSRRGELQRTKMCASLCRTCCRSCAQRTYKCGINLNGYRTPEQGDGENKPVIPLEFHEYPFDPAQRARFDSNVVTYFQKRPRLVRHSQGYQGPDCMDLRFIDRHRYPVVPDDLRDTRSLENGKSILWIEPAKEVAGEEGSSHFLDSI